MVFNEKLFTISQSNIDSNLEGEFSIFNEWLDPSDSDHNLVNDLVTSDTHLFSGQPSNLEDQSSTPMLCSLEPPPVIN